MADLSVSSHVLLLNYPTHGRALDIVNELQSDAKTRNLDIVIVDEFLEALPTSLRQLGVHYVRGNPAQAATLDRACLQKAQYAMVLATDPGDSRSDDRSLAASLTVETLAPHVFTVVECLDPERMELMRRSGANSVMCIAGLASLLLVQEVSDTGIQSVVSELTSNQYGQQVYMAKIEHMETWRFSELQRHLAAQGCLVLGVRRGDETRLNPGADWILRAGDHAIGVAAERPADVRMGV